MIAVAVLDSVKSQLLKENVVSQFRLESLTCSSLFIVLRCFQFDRKHSHKKASSDEELKQTHSEERKTHYELK